MEITIITLIWWLTWNHYGLSKCSYNWGDKNDFVIEIAEFAQLWNFLKFIGILGCSYFSFMENRKTKPTIYMYLQNIANDTNTPHICSKWYTIEIHYFRCNKLWRSKQYLMMEKKKWKANTKLKIIRKLIAEQWALMRIIMEKAVIEWCSFWESRRYFDRPL